ncbi:MAG: Thioredoxin-like [Rariglobus sp.]|jgi:thioredoxin-related protein|nr:Thioredoxin-like [Rariglobus sp.]
MIKYLLAALTLLAFSATGFAGERKMLTSLPTAIETASKDNKLIFITYGREACGNCQSLKKLINERKVKLFDSEFVLVDLDCDDKAVAREFYGKYRSLLTDAKTLPFVIVAKSDGTPVAAITSYKDAGAYNKFIMDAKKQANAAK